MFSVRTALLWMPRFVPWLLKKPYMEHLIGFFVFFVNRSTVHYFFKLKELLQNLQTLLRQLVEEIRFFFFGNHFLIMLFQFFDFSIKISHRIFQFWRLWHIVAFLSAHQLAGLTGSPFGSQWIHVFVGRKW
jgi:hypothetical protein